MTKYFAVPALLMFSILFTSCDELVAIALDDDTVCGEDVYTGYQPVSNHALEIVPLTDSTQFTFVNAAGEEMKLTLRKKTDQKGRLDYKTLCYNASYNISQSEYCESQMLEYIFENTDHKAEIRYNWYVNNSGEMLYDAFSTSIKLDNYLGGSNNWVADDRANELPVIYGVGEWARPVGDTVMLGQSFQNVTYYNWGVNKGKGYFFVEGKGVVAMWAENKAFWVLK
ncbi:MAG TPA: hypothetical protein PLO67_12405 [Saprospiraceae bacterium]|nr:hypothetical protein [Saprospiraceae bacterium]HPI06696.1 hypothetical protein [Saprospiraceae bacterium]